MTTITVGTGAGFDFSSLASAVAASQDGDVIKVQAGTYTNDFSTINTSITIEGVGGLVNLVATVPPPNLKGILTIGSGGSTGPDVTLDNIAFSGAAIPDEAGGNGAGIRYQSGNLVVNNCFFHDNQEGILSDADPNGTITINNSEFADNGNTNPPSSGPEHNVYIGAIQQLTIENSYFIDPIVGHDIKSRAANTTIENSRIVDPNGTGSLEIDLPNGGNAVIANNVIEKGPNAQNSHLISSGEEGNLYAGSSLTVTGNTLINDGGSGVNGVVNDTSTVASVTGNTVYGLTADQIVDGPVGTPEDNTLLPLSGAPALNASPPYLPVLPFSFACFAAGTRLRTPDGSVAVEALRVGQQIVVMGSDGQGADGHGSDGQGAGPMGSRPVRWIGHRQIDFARHADPEAAWPVRIRADAFADCVPARDLLVSPDHAIYIGGVLIPARLLENGATILRERRLRTVRYFHVELDRHDILLAEGLPAESYLDTGNRGVFENAEVPLVLHPDLSADDGQARREAFSCARFAADAETVEPVWRRLAFRAVQLGYRLDEPATTTDPGLHLLADGQACWPVAGRNDGAVFVVPRAAASVILASRSAAPCDVWPWVEDRRQLGVAVGRIVLVGPTGRVEMPIDHPLLTDGWWAAERDGLRLWRWTNGSAVIPLPTGVAIVEIHLAGETTYLQAAEPVAVESIAEESPAEESGRGSMAG